MGDGQWLADDMEIIKFDQEPLYLRAGDTGLLAINGANSAAHLHYVVKIFWEEFTL